MLPSFHKAIAAGNEWMSEMHDALRMPEMSQLGRDLYGAVRDMRDSIVNQLNEWAQESR